MLDKGKDQGDGSRARYSGISLLLAVESEVDHCRVGNFRIGVLFIAKSSLFDRVKGYANVVEEA
jgi:hypothetical protein